MSGFWARLRQFALYVLLLGGVLSFTEPAGAFEPGFDYWFVETISVGDSVLPQGIKIYSATPVNQPRASLVIENQTDSLLFVLSLSYKDVLVMETPDPNWKERLSLAHEVASYLVSSTEPVHLNIEALSALDQDLQDRNIFSYDPPPAGVAVPDPQDSQLLLVYGEQVLVVPFRLSYEINTKYDNGSPSFQFGEKVMQSTENARLTATGQSAIADAKPAGYVAVLLVFSGAGLLLFLIWLLQRQYAQKG